MNELTKEMMRYRQMTELEKTQFVRKVKQRLEEGQYREAKRVADKAIAKAMKND